MRKRQQMHDSLELVKRAIHRAAKLVRSSGPFDTAAVTIRQPINAVVTTAHNRPGSTTAAVSHQHAPIHQQRDSGF
jgi:hypothetical protein